MPHLATTSREKLEILYYTPYFGSTLCEAIGFSPAVAEDLCHVTTDPARIAEADAVLFHIPNMKEPPKLAKRPGQLWVGMSMESDANYPLQCDPAFMRHFDLRMSFRRDADVPMLYIQPDLLPQLQARPWIKARKAVASYFASNDMALNGRHGLVAELMKYLRIDSYGKSQNTCPLPADFGRATKIETIACYPFYFAFENSNAVDYVSEKVFDGLVAGTVPVYLGAPNIDDYLPGDRCIIKVSDFSNAKDLARYLISLTKNQTEYENYLAWKQKPLRQSFLDLLASEHIPPLRRLCLKIAELKNRK